MSFSSEPITWPEHQEWFAEGLADPRRLLYMVTTADGEPIGQVRFDLQGDAEAVVSVSIAPEWRGRGCGARAIEIATARAKRSEVSSA